MTVLMAACAAVLAYASIPTRVAEFVHHDRLHRFDDFGIFFNTATCLSSGACEPYPATPRPYPNLNPPHFHWLLKPLVGVSVETASQVWLLMSLTAVSVSILRMVGALGLAISPVGAFGILLAILLSSLGWGTITYGQVYGVLMWPVTEAWLAARRGRWHLAAALIAAVATIKPVYALPLTWLIWRRPRTAETAAATVVVVFGIGAMQFGFDAYQGWYEQLRTVVPLGHWADGSIQSMLSRALSPTPGLTPIMVAPLLILPLCLVLSVVLAFDLWSWSRRGATDAGWLGVLAATLLITPRGWMFSGWVLIGPATAVAQRFGWRAPHIVLATALLLLPIETTWAGQPNAVLTLLNGSIYTWAWLLLYMAARSDGSSLPERALASGSATQYAPLPAATAAMVRASTYKSSQTDQLRM